MVDQAPSKQTLFDQMSAMADQLPPLKTAVSVPPVLEVSGPCNLLLSSSETRSCLSNFYRTSSAPAEGDELKPTMFITAIEMNGTVHELGWFSPETSVGEIKTRASEEMCVPTKAIILASSDSSGSSLTDDSSSLGEVWPSFGPGADLNVVVQMPAILEETLKREDDIRLHEGVFDELVSFACQFEHKLLTPANVTMLQRVVQLICECLLTANNKASRGWAIKALSKLLEHSMKQLRACHHTAGDGSPQAAAVAKLENVMLMIVEGLQPVAQADFWLEQDETIATCIRIAGKLNPELYRRLVKANGQARACLGGA